MRAQQQILSQGKTVAIIGAGATGALAANTLLQSGYQVIIIEKERPGNGSSSRSAACIRAQFDVEDTIKVMMYSEDYYVGFYDKLKVPPDERAQPVIIQNGYLFLYETPKVFEPWKYAQRNNCEQAWERAKRSAALQQKLGLPVELLSPEEVEARWPWLSEYDRVLGATFCRTDGFLRHNLIYSIGIDQARRSGAEIITDTEVIGSVIERGRIVALRVVQNGLVLDIPCDAVVNATNAWARRVSQVMGGMPLRIEPWKRHLVIQSRPDGFTDEQWRDLPMTIYGMANDRGSYSRPEGPEQVLYGWALKVKPEPDFTDEDQDRIDYGFSPRYRDGGTPYPQALRAEVRDFSPLLASGEIVTETCGYYGVTPDNNPLIGRDNQIQNLIHAAGFSGHGLMHGPGTAVLVKAIITGEVENINGADRVRLPAPFEEHTIELATFATGRDFKGPHEGAVL